MKAITAGDFVKHKTIVWINGGKPFRVIKVENDKAYCEYIGSNSIQYFHEFYTEQLIVVNETSLNQST